MYHHLSSRIIINHHNIYHACIIMHCHVFYTSLCITMYHHASPCIMYASSCIIIYTVYYPSSYIIMHHQLSSCIMIYHASLCIIINHYNIYHASLRSCIIMYHHVSSDNITYRHGSSCIILHDPSRSISALICTMYYMISSCSIMISSSIIKYHQATLCI